MRKIHVGIDPDSKAHGMAVYIDGELVSLSEEPLLNIYLWIERQKAQGITPMFCVENVLANSFVYTRNRKSTGAATEKVAVSIGRNQQAQEELMRVLDYHSIPYQLIKPTGRNWANNKPLFQKMTGWNKRSNADTRSAAYFGFLLMNGAVF